MKYVNILTIHNEPNYGALLQAYALYHAVEMLGYNPRMIDLGIQYRGRNFNMANRMLTWAYNRVKGYAHCYDIAKKFSEKYEPCRTKPFNNLSQLRRHDWDKDDIYLVGSDQVWNPDITQNLASAYTLGFLPEDCKARFSYASSFGNIKDEEKRLKDLDLENTLSRFKRIGVREKFGVKFLDRFGIKAHEVIDPTLLLDDYYHLLSDKPEQSGNLLYLSLGDIPEMDVFVESLSVKLNLPVEKHYGYLQPKRATNMRWLTVGEWLRRIASSESVVTDSFHATVFSIIFERPFYVYISNPSKAFRIVNLLGNLGLSDRIVSDIGSIDGIKQIDYAEVKSILKEYRNDSINFLKESLS